MGRGGGEIVPPLPALYETLKMFGSNRPALQHFSYVIQALPQGQGWKIGSLWEELNSSVTSEALDPRGYLNKARSAVKSSLTSQGANIGT